MSWCVIYILLSGFCLCSFSEVAQRPSEYCILNRCSLGEDAEWRFRGIYSHGILPWYVPISAISCSSDRLKAVVSLI